MKQILKLHHGRSHHLVHVKRLENSCKCTAENPPGVGKSAGTSTQSPVLAPPPNPSAGRKESMLGMEDAC